MALYTEILHNFKKTLIKANGEVDDFAENAIKNLSDFFKITEEDVLMLTKIAAFFHDSAREDDGKDFWDHRSAENCYEFLQRQGIQENIARFFANAAKYKSEGKKFNEYCEQILPTSVEKESKKGLFNSFHYIRELICYADTLDIMRCRNTFQGNYIYRFLSKEKDILPENIEKANKLMFSIREGINSQGNLPRDGCRIKISKEGEEEKFLPDITRLSINMEEELSMEFDPDPYGSMRAKLTTQPYLKELLHTKLTINEKPNFTINDDLFTKIDFVKLIEQQSSNLKFIKPEKQDINNYLGSIICKEQTSTDIPNQDKLNPKVPNSLIDIFSNKLECPIQNSEENKEAQADAIVKILQASLSEQQQIDPKVSLKLIVNEYFTTEHLNLILTKLKINKVQIKLECTPNSSEDIKQLIQQYNTNYSRKKFNM